MPSAEPIRSTGMGLARGSLARRLMLLVACITCSPVMAVTNTADIMLQTVRALPACLHWRVSGTCFWLKCKGPVCTVVTSLRISHYSPDVVASAYHDTLAHPWIDYGLPLATAVRGVGTLLTGLPIDAAGTFTRDDGRDRNKRFRDADAIGHPLASLNFLRTGSWPSVRVPSGVGLPSVASLASGGGWPALPSVFTLPDAASIPGVAAIPGVSALPTLAALPSLPSVIPAGVLDGVGAFCPTVAAPFVPYLQSIIDSLTWRAILPIEALYPQSWTPGMREVGTWPLNSWGNVYPRDGNVTQQHPVKAAAVVVQRVGDVITRIGQPHVYVPLVSGASQNLSGYRVWLPPALREGEATTGIWQMLSPARELSCGVFGENDTALPLAWGDGMSSTVEGYSWSLWRPYSCCRQAGQFFLGAITF